MSRDIQTQLVKGLQNAHAMEMQSMEVLEKAISIAGDQQLGQLYRGHLNDTRDHERYVKQRLEALGQSTSTVKDIGATVTAKGLGLVAQAVPDTPARLAAVAYAFESYEIASYELLRAVARHAGDEETVSMCERILPVERQAAKVIEESFELAAEKSLEQVGATGGGG